MSYKLLYLPGVVVEEKETPTGNFLEIDGIEEYRDASLRNKVVFRMDLLYALRTVFSDESITKYRNIIYNLVTGKLDSDLEKVSLIFNTMYKNDKVFHNWISTLVLFDGVGTVKPFFPEFKRITVTMLDSCMQRMINFYENRDVKCVTNSHLYMYFGVPDVNRPVIVPKGFRQEVVSYAKIWNGSFTESEW